MDVGGGKRVVGGAGDGDKVLPVATAEQDQRDAKIYELRATMTEAAVAERFGLTIRRVQQIVRERTLRRQQK